MKRFILLLTLIILSLNVLSQNAYEKYIKEANEGNMDAQYEIGKCFGEGKEGTNDYKQAFYWYMKAANQGHLDSQHKVGNYYVHGYGVKQDYKLALFWYNKAAAQGYAKSECNIGWCYENGNGVPQDYSLAVYWYRKAAEHGNEVAQNNLGTCFLEGLGVGKDLEQAVYWYKKAVEQGDISAQNNLGRCYQNGWGVQKDYSQAAYWYKKAAEQGNNAALCNLGYCYLNGLGVEQDINLAEYWIGKAAEQGNAWAIELIPQVLSLLNEQENEIKHSAKTTSSSIVVDINIPTSDKVYNNYYAVIIGNEKYENEVDVPFAENDARIFKKYMNQTLGIPDKNIKFITNGTLNGIRIALKWLAQAMEVCGGKGQALFYYAGHGIPDESSKSAYLLPVDGIGSDPESAFSIDRLYTELEKMQSQRVLVFLDACFSGVKRENGMLASARGVAIKTKPSTPKGNMVVFTAAQGDETAYPFKEQQHGMFTYYLLRIIKETKGDVSLGDLAEYLQNEVKRQSFVENKKIQTPTVTASQSVANEWKKMNLK